MKFTSILLALATPLCTAFAPSAPSSSKTTRASLVLGASVLDTLNQLEGPGQVWGAEGINVGKEESDFKGFDGFQKFVSLLQSTGVAQALQGPGPFTVFAPTNSAIETYEQNVGPIDGNALAYCIVQGSVPSSALGSANLQTLSGGTLTYGRRFRKDFINDAIVGEKTFGRFADFPTDVTCDNGVIHSVGIMLSPN